MEKNKFLFGKLIEQSEPIQIEKPCHTLHYCPYGPIVEDFLLHPLENLTRCSIFGHMCPVYSSAEHVEDNSSAVLFITIWNETYEHGIRNRQHPMFTDSGKVK